MGMKMHKYMISTARGQQEITRNWDDATKWGALCGDVRIDRTEEGFRVSHRHDGLGAFHVLYGFAVPSQGHRKTYRAFIPALLHAAALVRAYEAAR
jgi:hypothetical protein